MAYNLPRFLGPWLFSDAFPQLVEERTIEEAAKSPELERAITDPWEAAYVRFETPEQEISKFTKRLQTLGIDRLHKDGRVVELFCGRGNGLHALERLGFTHLEGVDLSSRLVSLYHGRAQCYVCDCRTLPFPDGSKDLLIVQGGLHHLPKLPEDLERTFKEAHRVLTPQGRLVLVEPWLTPFLRLVHSIAANRFMRRHSVKLDALATMIEYERVTYEQWLSQPKVILRLVRARFAPVQEHFGWGKWMFSGKPV